METTEKNLSDALFVAEDSLQSVRASLENVQGVMNTIGESLGAASDSIAAIQKTMENNVIPAADAIDSFFLTADQITFWDGQKNYRPFSPGMQELNGNLTTIDGQIGEIKNNDIAKMDSSLGDYITRVDLSVTRLQQTQKDLVQLGINEALV